MATKVQKTTKPQGGNPAKALHGSTPRATAPSRTAAATTRGRKAETPTIGATRVALPASTRTQIAAVLNRVLASVLDLHSQVKHAHWNVRGPNFIAYHELFDSLAKHLAKHADTLAERARTLGGRANGTIRLALEASQLPEYDVAADAGNKHIEALADRYGRFDVELHAAMDRCDDLDDDVTENVIVEVATQVEKDLWLLESHLQA